MGARGVEGALQAFQNPTLDLLHRTYAPFVVTVLAMVFTPERPRVAVADAHAEINDALDQLRASGYGDEDNQPLPAGNARDLCRQWVQADWLGAAGVRRGRRGVPAVRARRRCARGRRPGRRSQDQGVRVPGQDAARRDRAARAGRRPGRDGRIARLDEEIRQRQKELTRLEQGGAVDTVDDEQLLEAAENVLHLARELPADFARVAESIKAMQRDVVAELRHDVRPTGEVLREYPARGQQIMDATPEGRAFTRALGLIGDPAQIDVLWGQLRTVLRHRFTNLLPDQQRRELTEISRRIEQGVKEVLTTQRQASHVITTRSATMTRCGTATWTSCCGT